MKFLRGVPEELQDLLQGWLQTHGASPSQVVRGGLYLDLALLLEHRSRIQKLGPIFTYAWGDATSKGGREIYNTRHRFLRQDNAVELARNWKYLCLHPPPEDEAPSDPNVMDLRGPCSENLFKNIQLHTQVPQFLGQGRTTLLDKVSAHVHSTLLESGTVQNMSKVLERVVAWVSDMGVESGMPSCHVSTPESTLPSFVRPSRLRVCLCRWGRLCRRRWGFLG